MPNKTVCDDGFSLFHRLIHIEILSHYPYIVHTSPKNQTEEEKKTQHTTNFMICFDIYVAQA